MPLRRYLRSLARIAVAGSALAFLASCAKNPVIVDRNRPPRTFLVAAPIDSTISHPTATGVSYSYRIHLYWRGEDSDGYVVGYLWAFDDSSAGHFHYTSKTDSIFEVTVNDSADITRGSSLIGTSRFHTFYVRAVDNLGKPDPGFAAFNRTTYKATTIKPRVKFVGGLPGGIGIDTLSDGEPFSICWTGDDSDGVVVRYKFDVGSVNSSLTTDTCAFFNSPGGIALASGLYNITVTAVDNAFATGTTNFVFVVNHDPETWFEPKGGPIGYYHPPYLGGNLVDESVVVPFTGKTVGGASLYPERNCLNGFSLELRAGTRNGANAYTIGFIDTIPGNPPRRFKSNEPNYLRQAGFSNFVLDSLDQGFGMIMLAAARDCSNRGDGTKAAFRFSCNYRPFIDSLVVQESAQLFPPFEPGRLITWYSHDVEDGGAKNARIKMDNTRIIVTPDFAENYFIRDSDFRALNPSNPHSVEVWVIDRAGYVSDSSLVVTFDLPPATSQSTRRP